MSRLLATGRSHPCGALRRDHEGAEVTLFGWVHRRRDHGGRIFVDLRDRTGLVQVVFGPDIDGAAHEAADRLRSEFCIGVQGTVVSRGDNENPNLPTGAIEVEAHTLEVFSESKTPPFVLSDDDRLDVHEDHRLRYRYLDLRRPSMQRNFRLRSELAQITRQVLTEHGFWELETPYLVKYTPGGARNFLVPSRLNPGTFYALAESPQIYKQLFMVAGFDRYFQITRCFRDEDLRNDRQPEFTQIDVEMSFATPDRVFEPIEQLLCAVLERLAGHRLAGPIPRMTWQEAMDRFGSDKPDLRFGLELVDVTSVTRACGFRVFEGAPLVKGLCLPPDRAARLSRTQLDKLTDFVRRREHGGAKGLAWARVEEGGSLKAPFAKNLREGVAAELVRATGAVPGGLLLFVADDFETVHAALSSLRLHLRDLLGLLEGAPTWKPVWITEFPLFERASDGAFVSSHHPFTSPLPEHVPLLDEDPARVRAQAYDLVLNGNEIGGGSIRIHRADVQAKVFEVLGLSEEEKARKFGFLLEAFQYGPPPHGGIALGLDRIAMLLAGATSLRDVIAFPKTQRGHDLMTGCPTPVDPAQLEELFITHRPLPSRGGDDGP